MDIKVFSLQLGPPGSTASSEPDYPSFSAGIVFGYSGLYDVFLFEEKAFGEFCEDGKSPCAAQQERLSRMYTIGATTLSGCSIFIGK